MINKLQNAIDQAEKIVFFSGAGMSTASGIPDFRSSTGLYKNIYRAEEMLSHTFFKHYPEDFYDFYKTKMLYPDARPNYAHEFIAKLQDYKDVSVVTQNIDGLHQAAGSKNVYELHGSVLRNYCTHCHRFFDLSYIIESEGVPKCDECGAIIKPDVVLYEESLDENVINGALRVISQADLLVVCGTSLVVYPAAGFIRYFSGNNLAIINRDATSYDSNCDIVIHDDLVKTFKQLKIRD
ncbi:MAG: NAD-dependent protein deacylase [Erysipelotrichaceae bacterium]|nr:NAD-dependent protein deacylase [Erysipelotrichaceae bacterium]MBQ1788294.1 NAD-dependent protein deacylase [Erysipelotrichaceae bacterium]